MNYKEATEKYNALKTHGWLITRHGSPAYWDVCKGPLINAHFFTWDECLRFALEAEARTQPQTIA